MFQITIYRYLYMGESSSYRRAVASCVVGFLSDLLARYARSLRSEAPPRIMLNILHAQGPLPNWGGFVHSVVDSDDATHSRSVHAVSIVWPRPLGGGNWCSNTYYRRRGATPQERLSKGQLWIDSRCVCSTRSRNYQRAVRSVVTNTEDTVGAGAALFIPSKSRTNR
jgi:hypothetical protein